ncbi:hypothetical protein CSB85_3258 [Pseudomonas aeruginosa]|nr:Hypothetical protein SCV20265_4405 [Pseudomonas aeruginosa SCV20265]AVJ90904.1 hypothetical protein CSB97_3095 [Pseudomonas aeruginosa]EYU02769.1 hypothetical protein PA99_1274 [Pseudomonas aeruginosa PA99]CCQ88008.1 hypothetical protein PA18A_4624 [Pseudomonas aeruginosa 18A]AVK26096.1 hypothetical protein CSB85_3258 [Pseudomonas aeruginosa]
MGAPAGVVASRGATLVRSAGLRKLRLRSSARTSAGRLGTRYCGGLMRSTKA